MMKVLLINELTQTATVECDCRDLVHIAKDASVPCPSCQLMLHHPAATEK